jgi:Na+/melibiose symporter-like transporter
MDSSKSNSWKDKLREIVLAIIIVVFVGAMVFVFTNNPSTYSTASLTFLLGGLILLVGYYHLVYVLPEMTKDGETRVSVQALRASFWLVAFGLAVVLIGILFLMNILSPWTWHT